MAHFLPAVPWAPDLENAYRYFSLCFLLGKVFPPMPMSYKARVLENGCDLWDIGRAPRHHVEVAIQRMLAWELMHLEASAAWAAAKQPVPRILWARGMHPDTWPTDDAGPMPGELCIALTGIREGPRRFQLIPIPAINKDTQQMTIRWVGLRHPDINVSATLVHKRRDWLYFFRAYEQRG